MLICNLLERILDFRLRMRLGAVLRALAKASAASPGGAAAAADALREATGGGASSRSPGRRRSSVGELASQWLSEVAGAPQARRFSRLSDEADGSNEGGGSSERGGSGSGSGGGSGGGSGAKAGDALQAIPCLLYTSPSPRDS